MSLGPLEIIVILVVALLIFGPKNLPKLGSALGKTVKNVREGMEGDEGKDDEKKATETEASIEDADADADAADENVKFCPKCGTKNPADNAFCSKCGAKLE
ncbi:twin-arginine translocase TatA/TatE family subunit [Olsenella sp. AGMB03486]|jgi:sec-independent protein translocase protein TatA|nr:twin-arginine translocase TatA/TatE family subunit [Olsenella sp.]MDY3969877.1 twin-arginine translocase TatA/TatE family subunit [Atopobiaceae bacterium]MDY5003040.1 twin-arginine translocase TatA/TatE family subunit [Atopobiaceae bacterium]MDY5274420.1 twin-arginine translocase TatA/TatE family subunit [Atopobiaceae bacterium]